MIAHVGSPRGGAPFKETKMPKNKLYDHAEIYHITGVDLIGIDYVKDGKVIKKIKVEGLEYGLSNLSRECFLFKKFKEIK